jgi:hypothetical protein
LHCELDVQQAAFGWWLQRPRSSSQLSTVHATPSEQSGRAPARHVPPRQRSAPLQNRPSSHGVSSGLTQNAQSVGLKH